jgi:hypothetical protein
MMRRIPIWTLVALSLAACSGATAAPGDPQPRPQPVRPQPQPVRPQPQPVPVQQQPAQQQRPPISAAVRQVKATPYVRATTRTAWPATTKRRQLVISGGWRADEGFAWFIADGTKVVAVYRTTTKDDLDDLVAKFTRDMVFTTVGSPTDKASWGIAGVIQPPPPPPPEPGGFPWDYIERVHAAAWRLDTQVLQPQLQPVKASTGSTVVQP